MKLDKQLIEETVAKHGGSKKRFKHIAVTSDEETYEYLLKKMNRNVAEAVATAEAQKDYTAINNIMLKNCVLLGDMEAIDEDIDLFEQVMNELQKLKTKYTVKVKNV